MRSDWSLRYTRDSLRDVAFVWFPTLSWAELIAGRRISEDWNSRRRYAAGQLAHGPNTGLDYRCLTPHRDSDPEDESIYWTTAGPSDFDLPDPVDLSAYATSISRTSSRELRFILAVPEDFTSPGSGDIVAILENSNGGTIWAGAVDGIDHRTEQRGSSRTLSGTARSRDASPLWRRTSFSTPVYPVGTDLAAIAGDLLKSLGLADREFPTLQPFGRWTPHTTTQLADMPAWEMLGSLLFPVVAEPWVDALGRFKPISRDVRREADLVVDDDSILSISESSLGGGATSAVLVWKDHVLAESTQQEQSLGQVQITAGYFALRQHAFVFWGPDHARRAKNTHMRILQTANSAEAEFCEESYEQIDEFSGRVSVVTSAAVPTILASTLYTIGVGLLAPDSVVVEVGLGYTIRVGTLICDAGLLGLAAIMRQVGTGSYEIWGVPFDYIFPMNRTEVFLEDARPWTEVVEDLESDFIIDEDHAQRVAEDELIHRHLAASPMSVQLVDDQRIEPGDILLLRGQKRFYVEDLSQEFSRGSAATINLTGFRI